MTSKSAERLDDALEDLEDLFENAPCGYLSVSADGRIFMANLTFAKWLGHKREALIGRRFQDYLNIAGKIFYETHFAPLMRMQGFFNEVALDLVRADGATLPVLVNAVERRDGEGALRFVRITVFNASDRRRYERELLQARRAAEAANAEFVELNRTLEQRVAEAVEVRLRTEEALRQAQKMEAIGQLTGGIAHDFNNMLAIVISALNLLERRLGRGEPVENYILAAKDSAIRAATLTQRLLAFARQQALEPQEIDPNALVAEMTEILRRTLGETIDHHTALADGIWHVYVDKNQLENLLINLAVNARDAMPGGGRLSIETANCQLDDAYAAEHAISPGQYVLISVADTGTGMSPEVIARAFDPFFTTKAAGAGTGLGLSQVFGFVKQSNGHIEIHSQVGRGTRVKVYLPRHEGTAHEPPVQDRTARVLGSRREVILVVEDEERVLDLVAQMLQELGYTTLRASSGREALEVLAAHPETQLLFTDVVLGEMGGARLAEEALRRRPGLKVLFTSGYAPDAAIRSTMSNSGAELVQKPVSLDRLAVQIRAALDA